MHYITPTLQTATMGEGSPAAACSDKYGPVEENGDAEFHPLHMTWVVVSDPNGNRQLRMQWGTN